MTATAPLTGHPTTRRRRRPVPVTILALIQIVLGVLNLGVAFALTLDSDMDQALDVLIDRSAFAFVDGTALILAFVVIGVLELTSAAFLLRLRRTGWTLAMLLSGASLTVQVITYFSTGRLTTLALLLYVVSVLYLNQRGVREAFGLLPAGHAALEDERG
jgi:hypothetical protein